MGTTDLISREAAVREALGVYHALESKRAAAEAAEDTGSEVVFAAAAAVAKSMVRRLMELPAAGGAGAETAEVTGTAAE